MRVNAMRARGSRRSLLGALYRPSLVSETGSPTDPRAHPTGFLFLPSSLPSIGDTEHGSELHKDIIFRWVLGVELRLSCLYDKGLAE